MMSSRRHSESCSFWVDVTHPYPAGGSAGSIAVETCVGCTPGTYSYTIGDDRIPTSPDVGLLCLLEKHFDVKDEID